MWLSRRRSTGAAHPQSREIKGSGVDTRLTCSHSVKRSIAITVYKSVVFSESTCKTLVIHWLLWPLSDKVSARCRKPVWQVAGHLATDERFLDLDACVHIWRHEVEIAFIFNMNQQISQVTGFPLRMSRLSKARRETWQGQVTQYMQNQVKISCRQNDPCCFLWPSCANW